MKVKKRIIFFSQYWFKKVVRFQIPFYKVLHTLYFLLFQVLMKMRPQEFVKDTQQLPQQENCMFTCPESLTAARKMPVGRWSLRKLARSVAKPLRVKRPLHLHCRMFMKRALKHLQLHLHLKWNRVYIYFMI